MFNKLIFQTFILFLVITTSLTKADVLGLSRASNTKSICALELVELTSDVSLLADRKLNRDWAQLIAKSNPGPNPWNLGNPLQPGAIYAFLQADWRKLNELHANQRRLLRDFSLRTNLNFKVQQRGSSLPSFMDLDQLFKMEYPHYHPLKKKIFQVVRKALPNIEALGPYAQRPRFVALKATNGIYLYTLDLYFRVSEVTFFQNM